MMKIEISEMESERDITTCILCVLITPWEQNPNHISFVKKNYDVENEQQSLWYTVVVLVHETT